MKKINDYINEKQLPMGSPEYLVIEFADKHGLEKLAYAICDLIAEGKFQIPTKLADMIEEYADKDMTYNDWAWIRAQMRDY